MPTSSFTVIQSSASHPPSSRHKPRSTSKPLQKSKLKAKQTHASNDRRFEQSVQRSHERRAIDSLASLHWLGLLIEPAVSRGTLKAAARHISPAEYTDDVLVERHASGLCGYPPCPRPPRRPFTDKSVPQLRLCTKASRVVDVKEASQFCSPICAARSRYFLASVLGREPAWALPPTRPDDEQAELAFLLLEEIQEQLAKPDGMARVTPHVEATHEPGTSVPLISPDLPPAARTNLSAILSSMHITEHPPRSADEPIPAPPDPTHLALEPDARILGSAHSAKSSIHGCTKSHDLVMLDSLSSSLQHTLTSQAVLANARPGAFQCRAQARPSHAPDDELSLAQPGLAAEAIYNVGSSDEQRAIDEAMALRDQLGL